MGEEGVDLSTLNPQKQKQPVRKREDQKTMWQNFENSASYRTLDDYVLTVTGDNSLLPYREIVP
jgi:hypothetical protein